MIPKIIHYCWFGKTEKSKLVLKCIDSWKKNCPDYEIIEWNEDNFDISDYPYAKYCYENKKYAFLSDFVRLVVVARHGGIYFDTDVEVIRPFDVVLNYEAFYGFENDRNVNTGMGFGAVAGHITIEAMKEEYLRLKPDEQGDFPIVVCPQLNTRALIALGLKLNGECQNICGAAILPAEFMNPYDDATGVLKKTKNTLSIHWYSKSWMNKRVILQSKVTRVFHRIWGKDCFEWMKR